MNYTVLGATVNLAARLEALNKEHGTEILVSEAVVERASGGFDFRFVDTVRPKGFEEPCESSSCKRDKQLARILAGNSVQALGKSSLFGEGEDAKRGCLGEIPC